MKPAAKMGAVAGGYLAAAVIAAVVAALSGAITEGPDQQASAGMSAFGDGLLFLAVFGVACVPPTGAGLFFLRPYPSFWRIVSVLAVAASATGLLALVVYVAQRYADAGSFLHAWSALAVLRLLVAPLFAGACFVSALFAPRRGFRLALLSATFVETAVFVCMLVGMTLPFSSH